MNTEQTEKSLGQIAYEEYWRGTPMEGLWSSVATNNLVNHWERTAQAIVAEVLKRLPEWSLLDPGMKTVTGDECWSWELRCWMTCVTSLIVDEGDIIRRRISPVPEQQTPLGSPEDIHPAQGESPPDVTDVLPPAFTKPIRTISCEKCGGFRSAKETSTGTFRCKTCCHVSTVESIGSSGETSDYQKGLNWEKASPLISTLPPAPLVDVWKCPKCGHSFRADAPLKGIVVSPQHVGTLPSKEEVPSIQLAPPAPRAEWKPKFKTGDKVIKTDHGPTIGDVGFICYDEKTVQVYWRNPSTGDITHSTVERNQDALEPAPWKLPEPPETGNLITEGTRDIFMEKVREKVESIERQVQQLHESKVQIEKERDAALARASEAEDKAETFREEATHTFGEYKKLESELSAARASVPVWVPIESAPKDGTEILGYRKDCGVMLIRWTSPAEFLTQQELDEFDGDAQFESWFYADFVHGDRLEGDEVPTHWMILPPLPVETEEGTDMDRFNRFWDSEERPKSAGPAVMRAQAYQAFLAALRSKKPPVGSP